MTYRQPFSKEWPITQKYGDTFTSAFHTGIDYGCPLNTPILASADGVVVYAGWDPTGYGNMVILLHNDGRATLYAHLSSIHVKLGERVKQGSLIGHSGTTGNSTGPHLHFEARNIWNDYKSHFDPMNLPLMTVDDTIQGNVSPDTKPVQPDSSLLEPDSLNAIVYITAPAGAWAHNKDFTSKIPLSTGTELEFNGNIIEKDGLKFCECRLPVWIAVHNNETQILNNK